MQFKNMLQRSLKWVSSRGFLEWQKDPGDPKSKTKIIDRKARLAYS